MNLQTYWDNWIEESPQTGEKIQRNVSKLECVKKPQVGQSTLQNPKGQKNITFLSAMLKESVGIVGTKTAPNHFYPLFEKLTNISQYRACTEENKKRQIEDQKKNILASSTLEIKTAEDHLENCQRQTTNLLESSFSILKKGKDQLMQKLSVIGNFKEEKQNQQHQINEFDRGINNGLDLKSLEITLSILNKIDNQENNGRDDVDYMQQVSQIGYTRNNSELSKIRNELLNDNSSRIIQDQRSSGIRNLDRCLPGRAAQRNAVIKSYSQDESDMFYSNLKPDELDKMIRASHSIEDKLEDFQSKMVKQNKQKLEEKIAKLDNLVDLTEKHVKSFLLKLPLDYFQREGEKVLKHFQLPKYDKLSQLQGLPVKLEAFNISFSAEDLKRLQPKELINDNLLECYSLYLNYSHQYLNFNKNRVSKTEYEGDIFIFSQLFFESLFDGTRIKKEEAMRFINNVVPINDLFNPQIINRFGFIVNVDYHSIKHWIFFGVFNKTREIVYYDSAGGSQSTYFRSISEALKRFFQQIGGGDYSVRCQDPCPRQDNGIDCGMFVMKFIQNFAYGTEQKFTQAQVTALREKIYTFFPLLAYQLAEDSLDFDLLQFYEDRFSTKSEDYVKKFQSNFAG